MAVSKQTVKNYLENERDLTSKLKKSLDNESFWPEFKNDFIGYLVDYSKNPSDQSKGQLLDLISRYSTYRSVDANDCLDRMIRDLGIRETERRPEETTASKSKSREMMDLYRQLGMVYLDTRESNKSIDRDFRRRQIEEYDRKYGKVKLITSKTTLRDLKPDSKPQDKPKAKKKDGNLKRTLKLRYFRLTSTMLDAPGEVPPKILASHRKALEDAQVKLEAVLVDLGKAKQSLSGRNAKSDKLPDEIKDIYDQMARGELTEEGLSNFEETLEAEEQTILGELDASVKGLFKKDVFAKKLRKFGKENLTDIPEDELEEEIQYVLQDATVDKEGKLVLPKYSIFKDVIFDEKGEIRPGQENLAELFIQKTEMDRFTDLPAEELLALSKQFAFNQGKSIDLPKDSKGYRLFRFMEAHPELLDYKKLEGCEARFQDRYNAYSAIQNVAEETQVTHKMLLAEQIQGQLGQLDSIVIAYDALEVGSEDGLDRKVAKRREIALKMARRKVEALEKAGLSKVVAEGEKSSKGVINRAREILLPELENARDKDQTRFNKAFPQQENSDRAE